MIETAIDKETIITLSNATNINSIRVIIAILRIKLSNVKRLHSPAKTQNQTRALATQKAKNKGQSSKATQTTKRNERHARQAEKTPEIRTRQSEKTIQQYKSKIQFQKLNIKSRNTMLLSFIFRIFSNYFNLN